MKRKVGEANIGSTEARPLESRAVLRMVEAGNSANCAACGKPVKFAARVKPQQVIANVYVDHVWKKVETFHPECYVYIGMPYGELPIDRPAISLEQQLAIDGLQNHHVNIPE